MHATRSPAVFRLSAVGAILFTAGCASGMTKAECSGADWAALGFKDGSVGERGKLVGERTKDCAAAGLAADVVAYEEGRSQGLRSYCTPEGGFSAGMSGSKYQGVCPAEEEAAFLANLEKGARLGELRAAHEKSIDDYDGALADLDQINICSASLKNGTRNPRSAMKIANTSARRSNTGAARSFGSKRRSRNSFTALKRRAARSTPMKRS